MFSFVIEGTAHLFVYYSEQHQKLKQQNSFNFYHGQR